MSSASEDFFVPPMLGVFGSMLRPVFQIIALDVEPRRALSLEFLGLASSIVHHVTGIVGVAVPPVLCLS